VSLRARQEDSQLTNRRSVTGVRSSAEIRFLSQQTNAATRCHALIRRQLVREHQGTSTIACEVSTIAIFNPEHVSGLQPNRFQIKHRLLLIENAVKEHVNRRKEIFCINGVLSPTDAEQKLVFILYFWLQSKRFYVYIVNYLVLYRLRLRLAYEMSRKYRSPARKA